MDERKYDKDAWMRDPMLQEFEKGIEEVVKNLPKRKVIRNDRTKGIKEST